MKNGIDRMLIGRVLLRFAAAVLFLTLGYRVLSISGSWLKLVPKIANRTYTTENELFALVLITCCIILILTILFTGTAVLSALCGENRTVLFTLTAALLLLFYLYCCLSGYSLLNNNFTTALLITGKYTAQLLKSILNLFTGIFGVSFEWDTRAAWYIACGLLSLYPFAIAGILTGKRNLLFIVLSADAFALTFCGTHFLNVNALLQPILGIAASVLSAAGLVYGTDSSSLGTAEKKKRRSQVVVKIDAQKRTILILVGAVLWALTIFAGRLKSFDALMRLMFSSDIYKFKNNVGELSDPGIARMLLISYLLAILVSRVMSYFSFEDNSRLSGVISTMYMLLLQIWVLPLLSAFLTSTAARARVNVNGGEIENTIDSLEAPADSFFDYARAHPDTVVIFGFILLGILLMVLLVLLAAHITAFRYIGSFLVYFAVCVYVYSVLELFMHKELKTALTMLLCYLMNRMVGVLLKLGPVIREKVRKR